jgi:hypothetical protein
VHCSELAAGAVQKEINYVALPGVIEVTANSKTGGSIVELFIFSVIMIIYGYFLVVRKETILLPWEKWAIIVVRKFYGDEMANAREAYLMSPERLHRQGLIALCLGTACLILLLIIVVLSMLV